MGDLAMATRSTSVWSAVLFGAWLGAAGGASIASAQQAPELVFDPTWPKDLPNNWKLGGVTGLALDADENIWLYNRPNDLTNIELHAELDAPLALCCVRAPSMIHLDRSGRVLGSFDAPQGHGMDVDSSGFVYLGQDTVRKYDPRSGNVVAEIARAAEREDGGPVGLQPSARRPGQGGRGPVAAFLPQPPPDPAAVEAQSCATCRISRQVSARRLRSSSGRSRKSASSKPTTRSTSPTAISAAACSCSRSTRSSSSAAGARMAERSKTSASTTRTTATRRTGRCRATSSGISRSTSRATASSMQPTATRTAFT